MDFESKTGSLSARLVDANPRHNRLEEDEDEDEALFAALEAEIENESSASVRERGLVELREEFDRMKDMKENQHGQYTEITDEKEVIRVSAREPFCVIHFYHTNFRRCGIMDKHLANLAPKYFATRFIRVFVENVPWLVEKLAVKVLPCVICFADGISKDRIIGFEELGNNDEFETGALELRLSMCGVIGKKTGVQAIYNTRTTAVRGRSGRDDDGDDMFDLDELN